MCTKCADSWTKSSWQYFSLKFIAISWIKSNKEPSSFLLCPSHVEPTVTLLDTTGESSLDWTRYPYGPQSRTPGVSIILIWFLELLTTNVFFLLQWVEESFTNFEQGINWRSYVVCDVAYNNVNNWLWTPFIERKDANRMYIEIKFSMRDCNLFPGKFELSILSTTLWLIPMSCVTGMALSCKETFSLLYYEFDSAHKEPPPWEPESYKLIDRIAADEGRFTSNSEVRHLILPPLQFSLNLSLFSFFVFVHLKLTHPTFPSGMICTSCISFSHSLSSLVLAQNRETGIERGRGECHPWLL